MKLLGADYQDYLLLEKENPTGTTQKSGVLGREGTHRCWLPPSYYNFLLGSMTDRAELKAGMLSNTRVFSRFPFPLGPSCHYLALTCQQLPTWSIQINTGLPPIHFCMAARLTVLQSKSDHVSPSLTQWRLGEKQLKSLKLNKNQNGYTNASAKLHFKVTFFLSSANLPPLFSVFCSRNLVPP